MIQKKWVIKEILHATAGLFQDKKIDSPRLCAEVLLSHQLKKSRVELYLTFDQPLSSSEIAGFRSLVKRRLNREPLQYITGTQEFWSLEFAVTPQALIPRPETELLVEQAIERLKAVISEGNKTPSILDLGTGCGAIAISLAKAVQQVRLWATDISADALKLARLNAEKHGVSGKIKFLQGNLWEPLLDEGVTFDIILSNPPYIGAEEFENLSPEVRDYEPRLALNGHKDGMTYIQTIILEAPVFMKPGGWIMLEMAPGQTEKALGLIGDIKDYGEKTRIKDYSHRYRVVMAQKNWV